MEHWEQVPELSGELMATMLNHTTHVSLYNLMNVLPIRKGEDPYAFIEEETIYSVPMHDFMNQVIRNKLKIIPDSVDFNTLNETVYAKQMESNDLYKPVWPLVDEVLRTSDIDIVVYEGQLDVLCDTTAALRWMHKMSWSGMAGFDAVERVTLLDPTTSKPEMFVKSYDNLKMYWVLHSGHVVPVDVPYTAQRMLRYIINETY